MSDFKAANLEIESIRPSKDNPRKHKDAQIQRLAKSIKAYGFTQPIVADQHGDICIGEGRYLAAKLLGLATVPVVTLKLTPAKRKALMIADNRLSDLSEWDDQTLKMLLSDSDVSDLPTGFEPEEIEYLIKDPDFEPVEDATRLDQKTPIRCPKCGHEFIN